VKILDPTGTQTPTCQSSSNAHLKEKKNNGGKQHRNKTQMENMQCDHVKKKAAKQKSSEAESFKHMKINI
jgi:hypothetical protein